jgi:hypothetical protein
MNSIKNIDAIKTIANALSDLHLKIVYVGGAGVSLYKNDQSAIDVHETDDNDIIVEIACLVDLEEIRLLLVKRGFTLSSADKAKCRFYYEGIVIDLMSAEDVGLLPGNTWFKKAFVYLEQKRLDEIKIIIMPVAYFLAVKFNAYHERGRKDPFTSNDIAEITFILDNRKDLVDEILRYPEDVQQYLKEECKAIIADKLMQKAIKASLPDQHQTERFKTIMNKLKKIKALA